METKFNNSVDEAQLNFEIAKILYKNTPLRKVRVANDIIPILVGIDFLFSIVIVLTDIVPKALFVIFTLTFFISYSILCNYIEKSNYKKQVSEKNLDNMISQIKENGFIEQFSQHSLFKPFSSKLSKPILYSDIEKIYLKSIEELNLQKVWQKQDIIEYKEKIVANKQRKIIEKYLN